MSSIVRRASVDCPFDQASQSFRTYVESRTVSLFGLAAVLGLVKRLSATVKATLQGVEGEPRCLVRWKRHGLEAMGPTQFSGVLWLEADDEDECRTWLVLDGEYTGTPKNLLPGLVARRLTGAIARDLLARVGDFVEAGATKVRAGPG
jgi:hypothetical protein